MKKIILTNNAAQVPEQWFRYGRLLMKTLLLAMSPKKKFRGAYYIRSLEIVGLTIFCLSQCNSAMVVSSNDTSVVIKAERNSRDEMDEEARQKAREVLNADVFESEQAECEKIYSNTVVQRGQADINVYRNICTYKFQKIPGSEPDSIQSLAYTKVPASSDTVRKIIEAKIGEGVDVNQLDPAGRLALVGATLNRNYELMEIFLRANAKPNLRDGKGMTGLMVAAQAGDAKATQLLLAAGADVQMLTGDGSSIRMLADRSNNSETLTVISGAGAKLTQREESEMNKLRASEAKTEREEKRKEALAERKAAAEQLAKIPGYCRPLLQKKPDEAAEYHRNCMAKCSRTSNGNLKRWNNCMDVCNKWVKKWSACNDLADN